MLCSLHNSLQLLSIQDGVFDDGVGLEHALGIGLLGKVDAAVPYFPSLLLGC